MNKYRRTAPNRVARSIDCEKSHTMVARATKSCEANDKKKKTGSAEGETGEEAGTLLSAIPLSPVLPSIDSTD